MFLSDLVAPTPGGQIILRRAKRILCSRKKLPFQKVEADEKVLEELRDIILFLEKDSDLLRMARYEDRSVEVINLLLKWINNLIEG